MRDIQLSSDLGAPRIEQLALAILIFGGGLDRHLKAMRAIYRVRRSRLISALNRWSPSGSGEIDLNEQVGQ